MSLTVDRLNDLLARGCKNGSTIVIGNESCDMDSVVSSLVYSLFLAETTGADYTPVLNVAREDLSLRCEVVWILQKLGIAADRITFLADVDAAAVARVVLVDHNKLAPCLASLEGKVYEILDHHADSELYAETVGARRVIRTVGSVCTLVALRILGADPAADDPAIPEVPPVNLSPELAMLLLGTILVDTLNNDPAVKKATPSDVAACSALRRIAWGAESCEEQIAKADALFNDLVDGRTNTGHLTIPMSLRKDYKQFHMGAGGSIVVGISSVLESLASLAGKGDLVAELEARRRELGLAFILIMCFEHSGDQAKRSLALHPSSASLAPELSTGALAATLELRETSAVPGLLTYDQGAVCISRKLLTPMLVDFFANES
ncbi:Exopolyphosphatase [Diplonema papillatum]|nr:Exopolyphosphatase [Diplonema papillatum]